MGIMATYKNSVLVPDSADPNIDSGDVHEQFEALALQGAKKELDRAAEIIKKIELQHWVRVKLPERLSIIGKYFIEGLSPNKEYLECTMYKIIDVVQPNPTSTHVSYTLIRVEIKESNLKYNLVYDSYLGMSRDAHEITEKVWNEHIQTFQDTLINYKGD